MRLKFLQPLLLIFVAILPTLIFMYYGGTSYALGVFIVISIILTFLVKETTIPKTSLHIISFIIVLIITHLVVRSIVSFELRAIYSTASIIILLLAAALLAKHLPKYKVTIIEKTLFGIVILVFGDALLFALFQTTFEYHGFLLFPEPSHLAIFLSPFFLSLIIHLNKTKRNIVFLLGILVLLNLIIKNLTLIFLLMHSLFILLFLIKRHKIPLLIFSSFTILILLTQIDHGYYLSRLDFFNSNVTNTSTLVYISGWERAKLSFIETYGIGYGFNMLGIVGDVGTVQIKLESLLGQYKNLKDGGSNAAKIVAEFGVLGVTSIIFYAYIYIKIIIKISNSKFNIYTYFFAGCYFSYATELFVRGYGYFSLGTLLFFASLMYFFYWKFFRTNLSMSFPTP